MSTFLTYHQVAERLHVPLASVRYWVQTGKLPAFKPGRHPLVKESDLAAFVDSASIDRGRAERAKRAVAAKPAAQTKRVAKAGAR